MKTITIKITKSINKMTSGLPVTADNVNIINIDKYTANLLSRVAIVIVEDL